MTTATQQETDALQAVACAPVPATLPVDASTRKWCQYLARGGYMTRAGFYHCTTRHAGPITVALMNRLEAMGLITLEPTASDTPELRHVRAALTPAGFEAAALPVTE